MGKFFKDSLLDEYIAGYNMTFQQLQYAMASEWGASLVRFQRDRQMRGRHRQIGRWVLYHW